MLYRLLAVTLMIVLVCASCGGESATGTNNGSQSDAGGDVADADLCESELTECADACVDTSSNAAHCGACGNACADGEACSDGECAVVCPDGQTKCDGTCRDLQIDPQNCGVCGEACAAGEVCSQGSCQLSCGGGTTQCEGICRDLQTDRNHCGACGNVCEAGEICAGGTCELNCGSGLSGCDGVCRDLQTDRNHCGGCGVACEDGEVCSGGNCQLSCGGGLSNCSGTCRDLQTDRNHCGDCENTCGVGQVCSSGSCEVSCGAGLDECGGSCRDLQTDRAHCGACGNVCEAGEVCAAGSCEVSCGAGLDECGGSCRDLQTDRNHCGACGTPCAAGEICTNGACEPSCGGGLVECAGICTDTDYDPNNCGGCGATCPAAPNAEPSCAQSTCGFVCDADFGDCNAQPSDGCEEDLLASVDHCGACGSACTAGPNGTATCSGGSCDILCDAGYANCDADASTGCTDLNSDADHCGSCGNGCAQGEFCDAGQCISLGGDGSAGSPYTSNPPLTSCEAYKTQYGANAVDGVYTIDPDGSGSIAAFDVYCDQTKDGGGWILAVSKQVDTSSVGTYGRSKTWRCLTPSYSQPISPTADSTDALHHQTFQELGIDEMMFMGGDRIIKFYYPRSGVDFVDNYRMFTERVCHDASHTGYDAPHSGVQRSGHGHVDQACVTTDFQGFKARNSCFEDATNSHRDSGYCNEDCGTWGNRPGGGANPPSPVPNCWFYGGVNAAQMPNQSSCPSTSQAPWANYSTGNLSGYYNLWIR